MSRPTLIGIGGAHVDRRGQMTAQWIKGASIPGMMHEEAGGGTFNALRVASQFGIACSLLSARGGDAAGEAVASEAKRSGIADLSSTFLDRATASYTALIDQDGEVVAALADMSIYEQALPQLVGRRNSRDAISSSDAVLIDANLPSSAISKIVGLAASKPVFALAISPAKSVRLIPVLDRLGALFLNHREARAILGLDEAGLDEPEALAVALSGAGLKCAVLTDGARPVCIMTGGEVSFLQPPEPRRIADVTGAGDALCGATVAARMAGMPLRQAVRHGLAAATLTVETDSAVAEFSDPKRFAALVEQSVAPSMMATRPSHPPTT